MKDTIIPMAETAQPVESTEEILLEQGRRIRALHEIISRPDLTFEQQIDDMLRLGCDLLGTEVGKVGRLDPVANESEFLNTVVLSDLPARRGVVLPLNKTFCDITFTSNETLAISHVAQSEYKNHPAATFLPIQSYIGCSIHVHGKKFGTVNFSNRIPVQPGFTEADKDLVNLMGSWISVMMERQLEAEELTRSKEAAEAANLAKSAFLANMSHEIRTPLTSIIGFADTAMDADQTEEQRIAALRTIKKNSDHLLNLINDILDFSKIEAGELDIEKTPMYPLQLAAEVESIVIGQAHTKQLDFGIDYQFPLPKKILSDPLRLKQILLNLCSNAIKFTDAGSVRVSLSYDTDNHALKFRVTDTGIGMSPEQAQKIFKPFKQADASTTRRFGGTGLGLSLSRRLAELLDGELVAHSESGKGSTFELTFRLAEDASEEYTLIHSADEIGLANESTAFGVVLRDLQGSVLLVEDNETNQLLLKTYLEKMGATVTLAENGQVGVQLAQQHDYDLIYMDMQMPVLSGIDAVKQLRALDYRGPIVMLTANATLDDRRRCTQAGCDDFLTKPVIRQKLYEVTARYLPFATDADPAVEPLASTLLADEPDLKDVLDIYLDRLPVMVEEIDNAFNTQDWERFRQTVHNLKGTGGAYGFPCLTTLATRIEAEVKQKRFEQLPAMLAELQQHLSRIQAAR
ncbi:MAG: ATP-binding protein [Gammaproteobacteria bacterium]